MVGSKAPIRCKVKEVRQVHYSERYSPEKISKFRESVIDKQDCYTPLTLARQEYQERQTKLFGEPLRFDDEDSH
ncbi:hypothetical protein BOW51_08985 [Solemya velesiana gill symbiont]|uniref:Uncharacterized protein n=1 Tax=Solemya velesiana gill symbiont TaxID=1918948 RepID=A0A1T2KTI9_9GAMM|nr:hypothetical protein BOW51_08985 [Solemya velesiana gill symbiont]